MTRLWVVWSCAGLKHTATRAEFIGAPALIYTRTVLCSHPLCSHSLSAPLPWRRPAPWEEGYGTDVLFRVEHLDQLWVSVLITVCCKQKLLWWGLRDDITGGYNQVFRDARSVWQYNNRRFFPRAYGLPSHRLLALLTVSGMRSILWSGPEF